MKDDEKVELKVGDIKRAAGKCGTAKEILKELFPEVFEEPWEDITTGCKVVSCGDSLCIYDGHYYCFRISNGHPNIFGSGDVKIEEGRIWRKREA